MTNAPYLLPGARSGYRMNNKEVTDCMVFDGLWDPYNDAHMGLCGETCAEYYGFTREAQDEFALESLSRTQRAVHYDHFVEQIVPIEAKVKGKATMITYDEPPTLLKQSKIPHLKPVFKKDGTITAANASSIADGAAAVCLTSEEKRNLASSPWDTSPGTPHLPTTLCGLPRPLCMRCGRFWISSR